MRIIVQILLIVLVLSLVSHPSLTESGITVERTILPTSGGLVYVVDEIRGLDGEMRIGIPEGMHENLLDIFVDVGSLKPLGRSNKGVYLYELEQRDSRVRVTAIYRDLFADLSRGNFELVLVPEPFIDGVVYRANISLPAVEGVSYPTAEPDWTSVNGGLEKLNVEIKGDQPSSYRSFRFVSPTTSILKVEKLALHYDLEKYRLSLTLVIRNEGTSTVSQLVFKMPDFLVVDNVRDMSGQLRYDWKSAERTLTINLAQSRYALQPNWRYSFTIEGRIRDPTLILPSGRPATLPVFSPINASVDHLSLTVRLPSGVDVDTSLEKIVEYYRDEAGGLVVGLKVSDVSIYRSAIVDLPLVGQPSPQIAGWILIASLSAIIIGAVVYRTMMSTKPRARLGAKEIELLNSAIREIVKFRQMIQEFEDAISPEHVKSKSPALSDKASALKRTSEKIMDAVKQLEDKFEDGPRLSTYVVRASQNISEATKIILNTVTDLQRGEINIASYRRIYESFRRDFRASLWILMDLQERLEELSK